MSKCWGDIGIIAFSRGDPLRRAIPYIGVYELGLKALRVAAELKMMPDHFFFADRDFGWNKSLFGTVRAAFTSHDVSKMPMKPPKLSYHNTAQAEEIYKFSISRVQGLR